MNNEWLIRHEDGWAVLRRRCPFLRRCPSRQPVKRWNGYGYQTVEWRVPEAEYAAAVRSYSPPAEYHQAVRRCPICKGHGLVQRVTRDDCYSRRCRRCSGSGRVHVTVPGRGPDERIEWDGTLTSTWLWAGIIDEDRAAEIRESCRRRHEETEYDDLLEAGMSKDEARERTK